MTASEDFLLVVLHNHIVAAARAVLTDFETTDVLSLSKTIVDRFVKIGVLSPCVGPFKKNVDNVGMYTIEALTLGLLWHNFHDSIKEGE